jgi:type II secretory pathway pseudopilin PulG
MSDVVNKKQKMKRGDTIIEVIFAITVFSMVSVLTLALMNRGLATTTASLQLTLARQEMDAQAEAIRFIHSGAETEVNMPSSEQHYTKLWNAVRGSDMIMTSATPFSEMANQAECSMPTSRRFALNTRNINPDNVNATIITNTDRFSEADIFPRVVYTANNLTPEAGTDTNVLANRNVNQVLKIEGLWIEAVHSTATTFPAVDFHIRACWHSPGQSVVTTLGTIVRLRDI